MKNSKFNNIKWTPELDAFIIKSHFENKESLGTLQKILKISRDTISKRLKKLGFTPINYQNLHSYTFESVVQYIEQGKSLTEIAKIYNISGSQLSVLLKKNNYILSKKFNENMFDSIDTEEKAYWLGFIFADGYISNQETFDNTKRHAFELSLSIKDINHLYKFNKFMEHVGDNVKVGKTKVRDKEYIRCRWSIRNKHLWETLNSYGCTPNKSLTLKFPNESIFIDKSLIRHFIRGYFDGDGCISRIIQKTVVRPSVSLLGTPEFINQVTKYINVPYKPLTHRHHSPQTIDLRIAKIQTICNVLNYLYDSATIYLERKYKLYEFFKNGSRSIQEWIEFYEPKSIKACDGNVEVNVETKASTSPYSVEIEPTHVE